MGSFYNTEWAEMMMSTARSKANGKPVANNTRLFDNGDGSYRLRLHNTDIVTYNADGTWTISAGGWTTVTTAQRVREYSPIKLLIESGEWYVWLERREDDPKPEYVAPAIPAPFTAYDPGPEPDNYVYGWWHKNKQWQDYLSFMERFHNDKDLWAAERKRQWKARRDYLKAEREWVDRNRIPFYDGITVNEDGYAPRLRADGPSPAKLRRHEREVKRVKKAINEYVNGFIAALKDGTLPMPGAGDCWYCAMRTESGQTMGDASQTLHADGSVTTEVNTDHLWSHIEEPYYVPSLAVNALRERGYKDIGIMIHLNMRPEEGTMGGPGVFENVKRDIVRYMSKRLIPNAPTE